MLLSSPVPARCPHQEVMGGPGAPGLGGSAGSTVACPELPLTSVPCLRAPPVCSRQNCCAKASGQGQPVQSSRGQCCLQCSENCPVCNHVHQKRALC